MGCDIHPHVEARVDGRWIPVEWTFQCGAKAPFDWRSYGMFGFLADVRNYSCVPSIAPRRGLPDDVSEVVRTEHDDWSSDAHSTSWVTLAELQNYDYDQIIWDRRVTKQIAPNCWNGAAKAEEGEGKHESLRDFLGAGFFDEIATLAQIGPPEDVRVVFWFDN